MAESCPVNFIKIDANRIRIEALFISSMAGLFVLFGEIIFPIMLLYVYIATIFLSQKLNPFSQLALLCIKIFKISEKPIDSAPKDFATKIGFTLSIFILLFLLLGMEKVATVFAIIITVSAGLEAVLNFCVGCYFYAILRYFKIV
jgi:hypothetical protein